MPAGTRNLRSALTRAALAFAIFLPPMYFAVMAWRSAILVPFWDEWELARLYQSWWDGAFPLNGILLPHNEHRPLLSWLTLMTLAAITDWSLRAENILNIGFILALFGLISTGMCRTHKRKLDPPFLASLALASILVFSPALHMCHWWSFLITMNSSAVYSVAAFLAISAAPARLSANFLAAALCWMSGYSAANGLLAFPICAAIMQLNRPRPLVPGKLALFWAANMVALGLLYFPGLVVPATPGPRADLPDAALFFLCSAGSPVASLITFPFMNVWDIRPDFIALHAFFGVLTLSALVSMLYREGGRILQPSPCLRLPIAFYLLGLGSVLMLTYGRAQLGPQSAYTSRYIFYPTFIYLGLILHAGSLYRRDELRGFWGVAPILARRLFLVFLLVSVTAFIRGTRQYDNVRRFNRILTAGLLSNPRIEYADRWLYPNPQGIKGVILGLKRHRIGPYRGIEPGYASIPPAPKTRFLSGNSGKGTESMGRVESLKVDFSGPRPALDVTGWAAPAEGKGSPHFVVLDIDDGRFRAIVPVGLPINDFLSFRPPKQGIPASSGWGQYWDADFGPGGHVLKAYSYFPRENKSFELEGTIRFNWPG